MKRAIINGNQAIWHTDIQGSSVIWTIASDSKMIVGGSRVSKTGDIVSFPSHPHGLDEYGSPINYRSHEVVITWTWKLEVSYQHIVVDQDNVPVWDEAGPDAKMQATQFKLQSN
jgi:hypothetical protein